MPNIGKRVYHYTSANGFSQPRAGIIVGVYPNQTGLFDVEVFSPKRGSAYHVEALERVPFAETIQEARQHFAKGAKHVLGPCNGDDPQPFTDAPAPQMTDATDEGLEHEDKENLEQVRRMASAGNPLVAVPAPSTPARSNRPNRPQNKKSAKLAEMAKAAEAAAAE